MDGKAPKVTGHKRSLIPFWFVGFFAVVFFANGALVYFALNSWTGLETESPYVKGLAYNRVLANAKKQAALGWLVSFEFVPDEFIPGESSPDGSSPGKSSPGESSPGESSMSGPRGGTVILKAGDGDGMPLDGAEAGVRFIRPTYEGYDRDVVLKSLGGGRYQAHVELPLNGVWDARASLLAGGKAYRMTQRLVIR